MRNRKAATAPEPGTGGRIGWTLLGILILLVAWAVSFVGWVFALLALLGGLHNSQRVMLALTQAGVTREEAYRLVQRNAMAVWQSPPPRAETALLDKLKADKDVTAKLDAKTLAACFDDAHHFARVDEVFKRVFG